MQCIHFTNTMLLLAALALTWWWLGDRQTIPPQGQKTRAIAWLALSMTVVVGATGSVAALADTLFPAPSLRAGMMQDFAANAPLLVRMRWLHPAAAVLALACALWLCLPLKAQASRIGWWVLGLIAMQFVLGGADVLLLAPTWMQVLHLLGADLYWIALVATSASILSPKSN
jgi:cytochrome c oxidase assembly protein subunit 15